MSVSGAWLLHYSWGCSTSYAQSAITFNADGSFGGDFTGQWVQQDGTLLLSYDAGPAKYGGTVDGSVASGAMSTFEGLNGCWYLTEDGLGGIIIYDAESAARHQQTHDVSGTANG
jgi:hypothetical protein